MSLKLRSLKILSLLIWAPLFIASVDVSAQSPAPSPSPESSHLESEDINIYDGYGAALGRMSKEIIDPTGAYKSADHFINNRIKSDTPLKATLHAAIQHVESHQSKQRSEIWRYLTHAFQWRLKNLPDSSDRETIIAELDSNRDFTPGGQLVIGAKGRIDYAPSYRVALLDFLHEFISPETLDYARGVFQNTTSDQERLLALSIIVKGQGDQGLQEGINLINSIFKDSSWLQRPVTYFVEAFDLYVAAHAYDEIPFLLSLQKSDISREHRWPAYLALYRLVERDPARAGNLILKYFDAMQDYPSLRADLFSQVVPDTASAKQLLNQYLSKENLDQVELQQFFGLLPNQNRFVSDSLFSEDLEGWRDSHATAPIVDQAKLLQDNRSMIVWLRELEQNPGVSHYKTYLQEARDRLEHEVKEMEAGRLLLDTRL